MLLNKRISISYFINSIKWQILLIISFALIVNYVLTKPFFSTVYLPISIPTIVGTAVSLLLAFRTAQSYERWWEARIVWGAIVNDSRTLIRLIIQYIPEESSDEINRFVKRQIVWTYCLGETLRGLPSTPKVQKYLEDHQINANNLPNALLDEHSHQLKKLAEQNLISEFRLVQINDTIGKLCDSMGKCERIKKTVFPRSYSLLVHALIYLFAVILPFTLDDSKIRLEVFTCIVLPIMFIAIEETAILMQDPFENLPLDTPMTSIAQTIEINLLQMINAEEVPVKKESDTFYEM